MDRESQRNNKSRDSLDLSTASASGTRARNGDTSCGDLNLSLNTSGTWNSFNHSALGDITGSPSSFGPLRSTPSASSSRAHRGPYARPACLNQSFSRDSSRYSPYAKKPIIVAAREVQSESAPQQPLLTSSAQKIVEIMNRNSTPVVDGLKVSLSSPSLKSLKPSFVTQKQEKGGPPIVRSPLNFGMDGLGGKSLPPRGTIVSSTPMIPAKRVNSSTNTPPDETDDAEKSAGGGKIMTSRSKVSRTNLYPATGSGVNGVTNSKKSRSRRQRIKNKPKPPFTFRAAWSPAHYTNRAIKPAKAEENQQGEKQLAINANGPVSLPPALEPVKVEPLPVTQSTAKAKEWECPTCMVFNAVSKANCVCCTEPRPAKFTPTEEDANEEQEKKPVPIPVSAFKFGFTSASPTKVDADAPKSAFVFGETPKSETASSPAFGKSSTTSSPIKTEDKTAVATYNCDGCWITNKVTDPKCICCQTPRPSEFDSDVSTTDGSSSKPAEAVKTGGFRFGITTPEPSFDAEPETGASESLPKPVSLSSANTFGGFKFGLGAPAESETSKATAPTPTFSFGSTTASVTPVKETSQPQSLQSSPIKFGIEPEPEISKSPLIGPRSTPSYLKAPGSPEVAEIPAPVIDPTKFSFEPFSGGPRKRKNPEPVQSDGPKVSIFGSPAASTPIPTPTPTPIQPETSLVPTSASLPAFNFGLPVTAVPSSVPVPVTSAPAVAPFVFGAGPPPAPIVPQPSSVDVPDQGHGTTIGTKRSHGDTTEPNPKKSALFTFGAQAEQQPRPVSVPVSVPVSSFPGFGTGIAAPAPAMPAFGNNNGGFNFGAPNPVQAAPAPAAVPFAFNPGNLNLNFGANGPAPTTPGAAPLFAFSAAPTTAQTDGGGAQRRPFKKAHRRIR